MVEPVSDDRRQIVDLTIRYCWALDDRDWKTLDDVFLPDATALLGDSECTGREAIVARCRAALEPLDASHHMVSNHVVEVDGDTATSRCYLQAQHSRRGVEGGDNWLLGGRYLDSLRRADGGWRIVRRVLVTVWTEGNLRVFRP